MFKLVKKNYFIACIIISLFLASSAYTQDDTFAQAAIDDQVEVFLLAGVSFQYTEKESPPDLDDSEAQVQIEKRPKKQMIEGYKTGRNGQPSSYVYGEIIEDKKGYISGYLYEKNGKKTYIYGQRRNHQETFLESDNDAYLNVNTHQVEGSEASVGEIVHDIESNEYLINKQ